MSRQRAAALLVLLASAVHPSASRGQVSAEATPLRFEITTQPGTSHTQAVTLTNPGKEPVRVRAALSDWSLSVRGAPQFDPPRPGRLYSASDWVRFAPPELLLEPGKQGLVRFTITVPPDVDPGGYRTGLLFEFAAESELRKAKARQVVLRSRIATLVYVHVGEPPADVDLTDLQIRGAGDQLQIVAALKNTSRRSVRTKGTLTLFDGSGAAAARIVVPEVPVLPESERELAMSVSASTPPLPSGTYRVELKLDVGMAALLVGETTLRLER